MEKIITLIYDILDMSTPVLAIITAFAAAAILVRINKPNTSGLPLKPEVLVSIGAVSLWLTFNIAKAIIRIFAF